MNKKYQLLNELARKGQTFTFEDAANIISLGSQSLKVTLSRMEKEGWIERIEKGKYLLIVVSTNMLPGFSANLCMKTDAVETSAT